MGVSLHSFYVIVVCKCVPVNDQVIGKLITLYAECESVVHVLWECPAHSNCRLMFFGEASGAIRSMYIDFDWLNYLEKTSYVLGSELWEDDFSSLLSIVMVWESRKLKIIWGKCMSWPPA